MLVAWTAGMSCCAAVKTIDSNTTFAEDALSPYITSGELPGAVSVFYKDGVQEVACLGWADVAAKRPVTLDIPFMQCSQTKGFCGVTIAMLVEAGVLSLDDPVSKYLPEFNELWIGTGVSNQVKTLKRAQTVMTVRMVMNHMSGLPFELPNYETMGGWSRRMPLRNVAVMAAAQPLLFEPGAKGSYSNLGIDVGAAIVEVISGMRWEDFLKKRVLDPLGMKDTVFKPTPEQLADKMELYEVSSGKPAKWLKDVPSMRRPYGDDRVFASAAAGLWTTPRDQLKFYKMLMNLGVGENGARILKEETVKSIIVKSTRPKGVWGYSLGITAPEDDSEDAWVGHGGARGSNCMFNWHKKELKLWVVQIEGKPRPWDKARDEAANKFFQHAIDSSRVEAYTNRQR